MFQFIIEGKPEGKARPRVANGHAYTPTKTKHYEEWIRLSYLNAVRDSGHTVEELLIEDNPVGMDIFAYFPIPPSTSKKKRAEIVKQIERGGCSYMKKPDADNIAKVICDALNRIAFKDDNQIASLCIIKEYTEQEEGFVEVYIEELDYKGA